MPILSERRYISVGDIRSGMMIQFTYNKKSGGTDDYIVLVVDPNKPNKYTTEKQLHGFIIEDLSDAQLIEFFSSFNKTVKLDYLDRRASVVEGLNTTEAYNAFKTSKYVKDRSYRTFNLNSMNQVRQILLGSAD